MPLICLYAMAASSGLLVVYLAALFAIRKDFRARLARLCGGWKRLPQNETLILHTLPYYLAITRSSCEVTSRNFSLLQFCKFQAYIFNIPIGQSITNTAKDVVTLGDFLWKLYEHNTRWKTWVNLDNIIFREAPLEIRIYLISVMVFIH